MRRPARLKGGHQVEPVVRRRKHQGRGEVDQLGPGRGGARGLDETGVVAACPQLRQGFAVAGVIAHAQPRRGLGQQPHRGGIAGGQDEMRSRSPRACGEPLDHLGRQRGGIFLVVELQEPLGMDAGAVQKAREESSSSITRSGRTAPSSARRCNWRRSSARGPRPARCPWSRGRATGRAERQIRRRRGRPDRPRRDAPACHALDDAAAGEDRVAARRRARCHFRKVRCPSRVVGDRRGDRSVACVALRWMAASPR